jgi:hypothetical protein
VTVTKLAAGAKIKTESIRRDCADQPKRNSKDRQRRQAIYTAVNDAQFEQPDLGLLYFPVSNFPVSVYT